MKIRYIGNEPASVPLLGRTVAPDEAIDVPDDVYASRAWPESLWVEVTLPSKKQEL